MRDVYWISISIHDHEIVDTSYHHTTVSPQWVPLCLNGKTDLLTGLLTGIQVWKFPVDLTHTCCESKSLKEIFFKKVKSSFSEIRQQVLTGHQRWGMEECPSHLVETFTDCHGDYGHRYQPIIYDTEE